MFSIKDENLRKLDTEVFEFNKKFGLVMHSLGNFPNIEAINDLVKEASEICRKIKEIKPSGEFDRLVIENYLLNLEAQRAYIEYFSKRDKENIDELIKIVLGKRAMGIILKEIESFNYKEYWDFYLAYQEYSYKSIPFDDETLREEFKKILFELKGDLLEYAEKRFNLPQDYEFDLVLGPPYIRTSSFHPTTKRMEIAPSTFFAFKEEGKIKINLCYVIEVLFHEFLGHGRQEFNSRGMPLGIEDNSINTAVPTSHIHAEGVAKIAARESLDFMKKYKKKYFIEDDYIKQRELSFKSDTGNFWVFYQYLKLKNLEDKKVDIEKIFVEKTKNYGAFLLYVNSTESPLSFIKNACYSVGQVYLKEILDGLKKEMGAESFNKNASVINQAISTGMWNFNILPKFVRYYLKQRKILV
jgi:hypothetical protein